jgi:hypothetical protein
MTARRSRAVAALDDWFHLHDGRDEQRNVVRAFVAIDDQRGIVDFYRLNSLYGYLRSQ